MYLRRLQRLWREGRRWPEPRWRHDDNLLAERPSGAMTQ